MSLSWFVTGASRGLGRELVTQALERGDQVAATLRNPAALADLVSVHPQSLKVYELDVADTSRMRDVVEKAWADLGRVDVVVSNAGVGVVGSAEEFTDEQIDALLAVNLTASIQLARAVAPHLRSQGGGHIIQISSMGGQTAFPGFSLYHASKWGIEGFFEAFAMEVEMFGIRTTLIEPGVIQTSFRESVQKTEVSEAYRDHPLIWRGDASRPQPGSQSKVIAAIIEIAGRPAPPQRLILGSDAYELVTSTLRERLASYEAQKQIAYSTDSAPPELSA